MVETKTGRATSFSTKAAPTDALNHWVALTRRGGSVGPTQDAVACRPTSIDSSMLREARS